MNNKIKSIAVGGIFTAVTVAVCLISGTVSIKIFAPLFCGFLPVLLKKYYGTTTAFLCFLSSGLLLLILSGRKIGAVTYIGLFGYYPLLDSVLTDHFKTAVRYLIKLVLLAGLTAAATVLGDKLFAFEKIRFLDAHRFWLPVLLIVFLCIYDFFTVYVRFMIDTSWDKNLKKILK